MANCHARRQTNVPHYGGLLSVLFITCHSIILQFVTFFHNSCPEYHFNEVWCICLHFLSALKKVPLISSNDRLVGYFLAWVCLFEFSFKLLYCYFVICSLQIEHFYCMFLSYVLALHKTWTHSAQFEWIILYSLKEEKVICGPKSVLRENKQDLTVKIFYQILWGINVKLHITVQLKETQKSADFSFWSSLKVRHTDPNCSLREKELGHFNQTLFFPFSCSPRPSQSCLSRFGHQILYTNIEGTRRPQSVPTILTETVFSRNFTYVTPRWL